MNKPLYYLDPERNEVIWNSGGCYLVAEKDGLAFVYDYHGELISEEDAKKMIDKVEHWLEESE